MTPQQEYLEVLQHAVIVGVFFSGLSMIYYAIFRGASAESNLMQASSVGVFAGVIDAVIMIIYQKRRKTTNPRHPFYYGPDLAADESQILD
jgi:hypothetical protein